MAIDHDAMLRVALDEARLGLEEGGIPIGSALFDAVRHAPRPRAQPAGPGAATRPRTPRSTRSAPPGAAPPTATRSMVTTLAPCWYCSGLIRQFAIPVVIVGESRTFTGGVSWLREPGVRVVDCESDECVALLGGFIARQPEVWNEDIGV